MLFAKSDFMLTSGLSDDYKISIEFEEVCLISKLKPIKMWKY